MAATPSALGRFFGGILRVYRFIRSVILNVLFLLLLLGFIVGLIGQPPLTIHPGTTLLVNPTGTIVEQETFSNPLSMLNLSGGRIERGEVVLQELLDVIKAAKDDTRIKSMLITTDELTGAGLSQLMNLGLPELIGRTETEFVEIAVALALDLDRLAHLRAHLRRRFLCSPLMDAKAFASGMEAAFRDMWRRWCRIAI